MQEEGCLHLEVENMERNVTWCFGAQWAKYACHVPWCLCNFLALRRH